MHVRTRACVSTDVCAFVCEHVACARACALCVRVHLHVYSCMYMHGLSH